MRCKCPPGETEALGNRPALSRLRQVGSLRNVRLKRAGVIAKVSYCYIFWPRAVAWKLFQSFHFLLCIPPLHSVLDSWQKPLTWRPGPGFLCPKRCATLTPSSGSLPDSGGLKSSLILPLSSLVATVCRASGVCPLPRSVGLGGPTPGSQWLRPSGSAGAQQREPGHRGNPTIPPVSFSTCSPAGWRVPLCGSSAGLRDPLLTPATTGPGASIPILPQPVT